MRVESTAIPEVKLITPKRFGDDRGWFAETYSARALTAAGFDETFVQDNQSLSRPVGVVRGLHYQLHPAAQAKLIRVLRGAIFDVAVDIRQGSPTFGQHVAVRLDATEGRQLLVPVGFAHGFCTLEPDTEIAYKVTAFYSPENDRGIRWNDPALGIDWPVAAADAILSGKDQVAPLLAEAEAAFSYPA